MCLKEVLKLVWVPHSKARKCWLAWKQVLKVLKNGGGGIRSGEGRGCSQKWGGQVVRLMEAFLVNLYIGEMKVGGKSTHGETDFGGRGQVSSGEP